MRTLSYAAFAVTTFMAATSAHAASIANGSFEDPVIDPCCAFNTTNPTGWVHSGDEGDGFIWRVGYTDSAGDITVAGEGSQFVTMGGEIQPTSRFGNLDKRRWDHWFDHR